MSAVVASVLAQTSGPGGTQLLLLLVMVAVFYLLLVRPQQKRVREQRALLSALGPGDRVVTIGGIHGTVVDIDDETVRIEAAPGVVLTMARQAIGRRMADLTPDEDESVGDELDRSPDPEQLSTAADDVDPSGSRQV